MHVIANIELYTYIDLHVHREVYTYIHAYSTGIQLVSLYINYTCARYTTHKILLYRNLYVYHYNNVCLTFQVMQSSVRPSLS